MPELRTLARTNYPAAASDHTALLAAHGHHLISLLVCMRFDPDAILQRSGMMYALLPRLSELCPALEHLVIHLETCELYPLPIVSPTLRDVDIICPYSAFISHESNVNMDVRWAEDAHVPALSRIRLIAGSGVVQPSMRGPSLVISNAEDGHGSARSRMSQGEHGGAGAQAEFERSWRAITHDPRGIINYSPRDSDDESDRDDSAYLYESTSDEESESVTDTDVRLLRSFLVQLQCAVTARTHFRRATCSVLSTLPCL
ncbi:hypothetical protein C8Q80DRAFT_306186 [Daedaleopsis nitida]|nr:hypothetical protein C8Q80DRAFT_306186 [Daedaleopsis nitida]